MAVFRGTKGGVLKDHTHKTLDELFEMLAASLGDAFSLNHRGLAGCIRLELKSQGQRPVQCAAAAH